MSNVRLPVRLAHARFLSVVVAFVACSGDIAGDAAEDDVPSSGDDRRDDGAGDGRPDAPTPEPIAPTEIASLCKVDAPHPKRLWRLSGPQLLASLRQLVPLDETSAPARLMADAAETDGRVVTRDFLDDADVLARVFAERLVTNPGSALSCAVERFGSDRACTAAYLRATADRLFRGRASDEDVQALTALATDVAGRSGGRAAFLISVRAMGLAPKSLYVTEGIDAADGASGRPLGAEEMAAFLSFRIAGTPPDGRLLQALRGSHPPTPSEAHRLIDEHFAAEWRKKRQAFLLGWLGIGGIGALKRDADKHPAADAGFMRNLQAETEAALAALADDDTTTIDDLLTRSQQSRLLADGDGSDRDVVGRPGVFALPGVIALRSASDHTNLPRRGRYLLQALFCQHTPPPPPNLTNLPASDPDGSERARFEGIAQQGGCSGCHVPLNGAAFALEAYDELGRMRTRDEHGNPIDPAATFSPAEGPALVYQDLGDLMAQAARHPAVAGCMAVQAFRDVANRSERGAADACLLRDVLEEAGASGDRLDRLLRAALVHTLLAPRGGV